MVDLILIRIQIELTFDRLEIIMRQSISASGWETRATLNADSAGHLGAFVSCTHRGDGIKRVNDLLRMSKLRTRNRELFDSSILRNSRQSTTFMSPRLYVNAAIAITLCRFKMDLAWQGSFNLGV
jgi:hypothetical protein